MFMIGGLSGGVLVVPTYLAVEQFGAGILTGWIIATVYVSLLGVAFYLRFRTGRWKRMRVIEPWPHTADLSSSGN
jgi:MATE family multidrug resistance protein